LAQNGGPEGSLGIKDSTARSDPEMLKECAAQLI